MDWTKLLSKTRLSAKDVANLRPGRTEFDSDVDRIVFSSAFRRLGRKTQVHPLAANDHIHTRLTHSLEVSRVGRALGATLGEHLRTSAIGGPPLPEEISPHDLASVVQAACLAHDLGNPPFGHAGEDAIIHWFEQNPDRLPDSLSEDEKEDLKSLEGNAQGFRILTQLENHVFSGGLQLTYATLATFQKYPWTSRARKKKFGAYLSEEALLDEIFTHLDVARANGIWARHPLAFLVEAADDICYGTIDIEDAVEIGILSFETAEKTLLEIVPSPVREEVQASFRPKAHRVNFARMRGRVFDAAISAAIGAYLANYEAIMEGQCSGSLFDLLDPDNPCRRFIDATKQLARDSIFSDTKKVEIEIGCYATFETLLDEFCGAALNQADVLESRGERRLRWKSQRVLSLLGDHAPSVSNAPPSGWSRYQCLRRVIDFVSGMTDNYATYIAKQMQGGGFSGLQRP